MLGFVCASSGTHIPLNIRSLIEGPQEQRGLAGAEGAERWQPHCSLRPGHGPLLPAQPRLPLFLPGSPSQALSFPQGKS